MIIERRDAPPVFVPAEHDLDAIAPFVASLGVFDRCLALLATGDAGSHPIVLRCFSEPIGVIAVFSEHAFDVCQTAEQRACPDIVASLVAALSARSF